VFVSVVVPCYRSMKTLPTLVRRVDAALSDSVTGYEIVLVVDGSPDDTWIVASGLAREFGTVRALRLARNYGQHNALIAGIRAARYDVVVTIDDDLQHPPEEIEVLLGALTEDVDLVYGVARDEEHGAARSLASRSVKAALSHALSVPNARSLSAFRAFRTDLRAGFDQVTSPNLCVDVALSWATTRIAAVPVRMDQRDEGRSGYTLRSLTRYATNLVVGYSTTPLRVVTYVGFVVGAGALLLFLRLLWLHFTGETTVAGFTTIAGMVALFASAQMVAIGVLGEYVGRIHTAGMGRPTYLIRDRVELLPEPRPEPRQWQQRRTGLVVDQPLDRQ